MTDLIPTASDDHVEQLAHEGEPVKAIIELIWNAIDAEAGTVQVSFEREDTGAIRVVHTVDDGHGISPNEVESTFGRIGGSWKKFSQKSKNGKRFLHGKRGEGRLRAFALGTRVEWVSFSDDVAGQRQKVTIGGDRASRDRFWWNVEPANQPTGTTVSTYNDAQRQMAALDADGVVTSLLSQFAPVLLNDRTLQIVYLGNMLDPEQEISHDTKIALSFGENRHHDATLRIIEWRSGKHHMLYFGQDEEHFLQEYSGSEIESQFPYSAYLSWSGLDAEQQSVLGLGDQAQGDVGSLWSETSRAIREHFALRRRERRREQIVRWKESGVYPYSGKPKSGPEKAERAVFDVLSGTLKTDVVESNKDAKLVLALLQNALRYDPDKLAVLVHEVVSLSDADQDALTQLLRETTLSAIIHTANLVANRRKFLVGLEFLLFDPEASKQLGERDHLHKILEQELWVFGEEYHLMNSERGLTQLLKTHLHLEELPIDNVTPVKRWGGKSGRVDLHLAVQFKEHDRIRHLVVELKAPDIKLTQKELNQVEDYAATVRNNAAFATDRASWDFILVGTDYDDLVEGRIADEHQSTGLFLPSKQKAGKPQVRAFVRRWRDLIDENKRRLDFVTSTLEQDPSLTEGLDYIQTEYNDLLPDEIAPVNPVSVSTGDETMTGYGNTEERKI